MEEPTSSFGLLERCRQGDSAAFSLLFRKYQGRLAVLIHYKLGEQQRRSGEVDDVLQETFLTAFRDLRSFDYRSPGCFMGWLAKIADHTVIDAARRQQRAKRRATEIVPLRSASNPQGPEPTDWQTPSRILSEQEALERLLDTLNALPDQYREVILAAKVEGLSTAEIAERLGKSREAVSLLLHRAVRRLRQLTVEPEADNGTANQKQ
jgi:RNA polymerase sigma-70 factor (ECF subfamily)